MFLCSLIVFCIHAEFRKLCELFAAELKRFCISVSVLKRPNGDIEGDVAVPQTGSWWTGGQVSSVAIGSAGACWGRDVCQKWYGIRGCDAEVEQFFRIF